MKRIFAVLLFFGVLGLFNSSCSISLNGATTVGLKTINVEYFENTAPLVVNYLSQQFTEALKDRIRSTTSLSIAQGETSAHMSGSITGYSIEPVSVQATSNNTAPIAGAERLMITVNVTYTNIADKKYNFTQAFSEYQDFTGDISSQEQKLVTAIIKKLTDDIFNKAFNNW